MPPATLADLAESFSLFDDWEDKYRYLIDLGDRLDPMDEALKTGENFVRGCTSQVWMDARFDNDRFRFVADSDSRIVKGLIYILAVAYQGRTRQEIAAVDIENAFEKLGLHQHLSPNRRNGFFAMVGRIRGMAAG